VTVGSRVTASTGARRKRRGRASVRGNGISTYFWMGGVPLFMAECSAHGQVKSSDRRSEIVGNHVRHVVERLYTAAVAERVMSGSKMGHQLLTLALETCSVLLAAGAVAFLVASRRGGTARVRLAPAAAVIALAALVVNVPIAARDAYSTVRTKSHEPGRFNALVASQACLQESGNPGRGAVRRLQQLIPPHASFVLHLTADERRNASEMCVDFVLLPRVEVASSAAAGWAISFGPVPRAWTALVRSGQAHARRLHGGATLIELGARAR
jgi:hypothetical protein